MTSEDFMRISREALLLVALITSIPVLAALVVGLCVSLFQAASQLQEQTLSVVPKLVAVFITLLIAAPWMVRQLITFAVALLRLI
jgi:flagellar biosynthetic protein FliQ